MPVIEHLSSYNGIRDNALNITLAAAIAEQKDKASVKELIALLSHKTKALRHDAIKVIYETGALNPGLISEYLPVFTQLLSDKDNRMQWGAMQAISMITGEHTEAIYNTLPLLADTADRGSVITRDCYVKILVTLGQLERYNQDIFDLLQEQVMGSPVNQLASYAESTFSIIHTPEQRSAFRQTLLSVLPAVEQQASKRNRIEKLIRKLGK